MFPEEQKVNHKQKFLDITLKVLSYLLAATIGAAAVVALFLNAGPVKQDPGLSKLEELQALIEERFIGEADAVVMVRDYMNDVVYSFPDLSQQSIEKKINKSAGIISVFLQIIAQ